MIFNVRKQNTIKINPRKIFIVFCLILLVYLFFLGGMNHLRAMYDNRFGKNGSYIFSATLAYMDVNKIHDESYYEQEVDLKEHKINYFNWPVKKSDEYFIYGDLFNYYNVNAYLNGDEIYPVSITKVQNCNFWDTTYLYNRFVIDLPRLKRNKLYEILIIAGNKSNKYLFVIK